jgi:Fe-S-cluster containining protein
MQTEAFARRHLRAVGGRWSLVEENGRCSLLVGKNECSVYEKRPKQCQQFPFWDSILTGGEALERARESCPGIFVIPPRDTRERAYAALREFYARADARIGAVQAKCELSGNCCDFPKWGHRLFATILEVDFAAEHGPAVGPPEDPQWCEFYRGRRCEARGVRPLACRAFFCDAPKTQQLNELHESLLSELRAIGRAQGYPEGYGDFVELLPARREAIRLMETRRSGGRTIGAPQ